jgi:hypothetical protein
MKRSLELEWHQEHLKEGRYNLNMGYIDKKIQEVVKEIIAEEFKEATRLKHIKDAKPEVSIAT